MKGVKALSLREIPSDEGDYLRTVGFDALIYLVSGASAYFLVVIVALCFTAPLALLPFLITQKTTYLGVLLALGWRLKKGAVGLKQFDNVVTLILLLCLSSAFITAMCGLPERFGTYCAVLILACTLMDITYTRLVRDWLIIWAVWFCVYHSAPNALFVDEFVRLMGFQILAVPAMSLRVRLYHRKFILLRELSDSLRESEQIRTELDRLVEGRTVQLQMAYEELHLTTQQRESITQEREKLHEQLLQSQKMESLGRLAGGVAHDFNNLLTVILGNLELVEAGDADGDESAEFLQEAKIAARRAGELTSQLLAFSRKQVMNVKPLKIQRAIEESIRMVERLLGEDIKLEVSLSCPDAVVEGDTSRLQQVLINLVVNARDAMPAGGKLEISLREVGWEVELCVRDSGCGIDPEMHARIFEPFFTNKPFGEGTGLGLSTVDGIVSMHSGKIKLESAPGEGAAFKVFLPLHNSDAGESLSKRFKKSPQGAGKILLVEDDDQVRNLALRVLKQSGYQVTALENGEKALQRLTTNATYELLVTDVVMPGMDGVKLAEAVRERLNNLPVLFMSGYADDRLFHFGIQQGECDFLAKPFTPAQLQSSVANILQRSKSGEASQLAPSAGGPAAVDG